MANGIAVRINSPLLDDRIEAVWSHIPRVGEIAVLRVKGVGSPQKVEGVNWVIGNDGSLEFVEIHLG